MVVTPPPLDRLGDVGEGDARQFLDDARLVDGRLLNDGLGNVLLQLSYAGANVAICCQPGRMASIGLVTSASIGLGGGLALGEFLSERLMTRVFEDRHRSGSSGRGAPLTN
jgi:hypothetical protein